MTSKLSLCLLFSLFTCFELPVEAYTVFQTNCTLPTHEFGFVQSPNNRGTLDILWSSLFTIIACTWSVLHLNVPEQRLDQYPGWKGFLKWKCKGLWTSLESTLLTVLAPELALTKSVIDLGAARRVTTLLQPFACKDNVQWTVTH